MPTTKGGEVKQNLEREFIKYARRYQEKVDDRRLWRGLAAVVFIWLLVPYLLWGITQAFPGFPDTMLRLINRPSPSANPVSPQSRNADPPRSLS